jgi:hypothetical protein
LSVKTKVLMAALVALAGLLATTATASAARWQYYDVDADDYVDAKVIDRDLNGRWDDLYFDIDNDGRWDTNLYNSRRSDALLETLDYDMDENGEVELELRDGDQRVGFDYLYVDRDQDHYWDLWRGSARRIIPGSNVDYVTRINRHNASRDLMYSFRMRTGMSLLYPSVPVPY